MKIITWNVAGIRACISKGMFDFIDASKADIYCFQEVKATAEQFEWKDSSYYLYLNPAEKAGYSGTMVATRLLPKEVVAGFGPDEFNTEGRVIACDYGKFYLICCYTPNSQKLLKRLPYRLRWEQELRQFLQKLDAIKPVIYCGDLNVCHQAIDIHNPVANMYSPGFSKEERNAMTELLDLGFVDVFRSLNPEATGQYTYWSYLGKAREHNAGWRLDYFIVSSRLMPAVKACTIHKDVMGSDHCPLSLELYDTVLNSL